MIVYVKKSRQINNNKKNPSELVSNNSKVTGYKVNTQKTNASIYISNEQVELERLKTLPFILAFKK